MKYLVVTGGVVSGLGKGITISSLGVLLKAAGLRVTSIKIDPYLNSDAGTMSPFEHGEVFVLNDGGEADLDLGNYERFLGITLTRDHNITTGKVYSQVIHAERRGDYLGKTVQVIPHVTDAIQDWIDRVAHLPVEPPSVIDGGDASPMDGPPSAEGAAADGSSYTLSAPEPDICLIEVGGTVGDIESLVFLEALRQFSVRVGQDNIMFLHVSLVPVLGSVGEQKTKPTQHSVKELRSVGLNPDVIVCRSARGLSMSTRDKLALFCQVAPDCVLTVHDVSNIYHVPLLLEAQGASTTISRRLKLNLPVSPPNLTQWRLLASSVDNYTTEVRIALVGKYTGLQDSYLSVIKALQHASIMAGRKLVVEWIDATALEPGTKATDPDAYTSSWETVRAAHGVLVPGGFGDRGVEGKIAAIQYARESKTPFLGICLGMQCAVIEYARHVLGWTGANSSEFDAKSPHPVVIFMPEINPSQMGGTMRLGARATMLRGRADGQTCLAKQVYTGCKLVWERHRHRYEVNPEHVAALQGAGLFFVGTDDRNQRMEIVELDRSVHPYFFGCQYHPEFQSHPNRPSPPFYGFVLAASGQLDAHLPLPPLRGPVALTRRGSSIRRPASVDGHSAQATPTRAPASSGADMGGMNGSAPPSPSTLGGGSGPALALQAGLPAPLEKSPARPVAVTHPPRVTSVGGAAALLGSGAQ